MNLVLVNYEYPPLGGGAGNATACIAHALARQGHAVSVVTGAYGDLQGIEHGNKDLCVIRLPCRRTRIDRSNYGEMLSFVIAAARVLPSIAREHRADGMIVFFSLPCGPLGWLTRRRTGTPYVISLRGGDVPGAETRVSTIHRLLSPLRRAVLRNALAVVANSPGLARLSERTDPAPVMFIPNGVDTEFFSPAPRRELDSGTVRFLFVGRFQSQKNLFVLLDRFAQAMHSSPVPLNLILIGDGPQRADLEMHARKLGIAETVSWPGWLDKTALRSAYREADVFLNPSLYEGMPNTVLEAMACGLPTIASRVMGNEDLVAEGETGLLFDLDQPDRLASAIANLASASEQRRAMGARARAVACERYDWGATAAHYAALFE